MKSISIRIRFTIVILLSLFLVFQKSLSCAMHMPNNKIELLWYEPTSEFPSMIYPACFESGPVDEMSSLRWSVENNSSKYMLSYEIQSKRGKVVAAGTVNPGKSINDSRKGVDLLENEKNKSQKYILYLRGNAALESNVRIEAISVDN